jgi:D-alanyl-D-alanine carboxypeptidase/D-alanyl-D-alanine-endopeptidase (penicillin-binding protein 4)
MLRKILLTFWLLWVTVSVALPAQTAQSRPRSVTRRQPPPPPWARRLDSLLDEPPFDRALWGVAVADHQGRILFDRNGNRLFQPASNNKLLIAAAATALLTPEYRFATLVYAAGPIVQGVVRGDLVVYGGGDPTFSSRYYPDAMTPLEALADSLRAQGITTIEGDVVGDASRFDSVLVNPTWERGDMDWEDAAPVTALGFADNIIEFRVTPGALDDTPTVAVAPDLDVRLNNRARTMLPAASERALAFRRSPGSNEVWMEGGVSADARVVTARMAVARPVERTVEAFRIALERRGIRVLGTSRATFDSTRYSALRQSPPVVRLQSPSLARVLRAVLEDSHNWSAEMLLKTLGRERAGEGSWRAGIEVVRRYLIDSLGIDSTMFGLSDGSGLSHHNFVAPLALVRLLQAMAQHRRGEAFLDALPVAGRTGTLRTRLRDYGIAGRVRAKTGFIGSINALSGFLDRPEGTWVFAIQLNNHLARSREAVRRIDDLVSELSRVN